VQIDLLVLGYGNFKNTTEPCLLSLTNQVTEVHSKIYVLDNGSPDQSATLQREFCKDYPLIKDLYSEVNLGYAGGMNYLAQQALGDWIVLIGSDTVFAPGALSTLQQAMKSAPEKLGMVCPVTNSAGTAQGIDFLGNELSTVFQHAQELIKNPTGMILPLYRADFFCVAIRKTLWNQLKGLDLAYGLGYYEDFDFTMRARQLGFECGMVEDAVVFHQGSASFRKSAEQSQLLKRNKKIFLKRFPQAELRHRRLDHLKTIQYYLELPQEKLAQEPIKKRIFWRLQIVQRDQPRSFWKKCIWQKKLHKLMSHPFFTQNSR
jgi:GT2 family glycosyltransferase